jgi:hypothetical protein
MHSQALPTSSRSWRPYGNSFKARDCHKASTSDGLKPLTCRFAPLAGLEPAPYGLEVRLAPSAWCRPGSIAPGGVRSAFQPVTSRPAPLQRPDCQRDCQV